jgi:LmbE family N-acetylglucosaminyl deacetylase
MSANKKVLFLGAHPDDIDFGCAVAMHDHHIRNDEITTVVLTGGERGGDSLKRRIEQINSFKLLAPDSRNIFLTFPDTQLFFQLHEVINQVRSIVLDNLPEIVYIPSEHDFHQDHVIAHECALAVFNYIRVNRILSYETPSTMPKFSPNFFKLCDLNSFQIKIDALRCHESQLSKAYFSEATIYSIAKMRAAQGRCNSGAAEAFEVIRFAEDSYPEYIQSNGKGGF